MYGVTVQTKWNYDVFSNFLDYKVCRIYSSETGGDLVKYWAVQLWFLLFSALDIFLLYEGIVSKEKQYGIHSLIKRKNDKLFENNEWLLRCCFREEMVNMWQIIEYILPDF